MTLFDLPTVRWAGRSWRGYCRWRGGFAFTRFTQRFPEGTVHRFFVGPLLFKITDLEPLTSHQYEQVVANLHKVADEAEKLSRATPRDCE